MIMQLEGPPAGTASVAPPLKVADAPSWAADEPMREIPAAAWSYDDAHSESVRRLGVKPRFVRWLAVASGAASIGLTGWQTANLINDEPWSHGVAFVALFASVVAALAVLVWTWIVVENARRLLSIATNHEPPDPMQAVAAWFAPLVIAGAAGASVVFLQSRLSDASPIESSPVPLTIALVAIIVTMLVMYRPFYVLSGVTRRLGFGSVDLARWYWVPIGLVVVGSLSLIVLNLGGAYGEDFEGVVPAWALGVVAIPPTLIVFWLAFRGGRGVEDAVNQAFARRGGDITAGMGRGRLGFWAKVLRVDPRPPISRELRRRIRLVPGTEALRLGVVTAVAALALLSIVGGIIMFLFWRESSDGLLLQSQQDRAWDALISLQRVERGIALALLVAVSLWSFVVVMNVRLATGRRRNPILAAIAWPAAAFGVWRIGDQIVDDDRIGIIVGGFILQAVVLLLPFFLLARAAVAVRARRQPIRFAYGLAVILLVHTQGLVGLSTLDNGISNDQFGRLAGYLGLAALMQLVATLAITESSHLISDAVDHQTDRHNFLASQRQDVEERAAASKAAKAEAEAEALAAVQPRGTSSHRSAGASTVFAASSPPQP